MLLTKFSLRNYKSFIDSGELEFKAGFNLIIGKNSAGKTALVEGMSGRAEPNPHRSPLTLPTTDSRPNRVQGATSVFALDRADVEAALFASQFALPVPPNEVNNKTYIAAVPERFLSTAPITLQMKHIGGRTASIDLRHLDAQVHQQAQYVASADGKELIFAGSWINTEPGAPVASILANWAMDRVYVLTAQRFSTPLSAIGTRDELLSDASNLAEVLHNLRAREMMFRKFNELVSTVFPEIKWVGTRVLQQDARMAEVIISMVPPEEDRPDLLIPLSAAGTGVGQVLSLLYVVLNSRTGRVIIVDEPQSFLHPGALRKLVSVLKQYAQRHQFVFTTHAHQLLVTAEPTTVTQIWLDGYQSKARQLTHPTPRDLQGILMDVGARLSDTFGADAILWVEGQSEELSFPFIAELVAKKPLLGVQILSVIGTSAFEEHKRIDAKIVRAMYTRLSEGAWLVPPAVGFILDREGRTREERAELEKESHNRIAFLSRRMFENYLLEAHAIANVICQDVPGAATSQSVQRYLDDAKDRGLHLTPDAKRNVASGASWENEVHAANLLGNLFDELSEKRLEFRKTDHGVRMARWIAENRPAALGEIAELLAEKLSVGVR